MVTKLTFRLCVAVAFIVTITLFVPLTKAYTPNTITVWTDKSRYSPGDTGTLYITFYNDRGRTLTIDGISIVFETWKAYDPSGEWLGNQTMSVNRALVSGETYYNTTRFLVPTDGRANSTVVAVNVSVIDPIDINSIEGEGYVTVNQPPRYEETIVTLLTVLLALLLICTVIVSAAILISARRPQSASRTGQTQ